MHFHYYRAPFFWLILILQLLLSGCVQDSTHYAPVTVNNQTPVRDAGKAARKSDVLIRDKKSDGKANRIIKQSNKETNISYKSHVVTLEKKWNAITKKPPVPKNTQKNMANKPVVRKPNPSAPVVKIAQNREKKSIISIDNKKVLKLNFSWPIKGRIARNFNQSNNKGIDIAGKMGQKVRAAEAGKIAYSGEGLIGFGNLVIIKHNDAYLSAYGNNSRLLVQEGEQVEKGQVIAQVGKALSKKVALHFEIRKNGKPVNPLNLLPKSDKTL